MDIYFLKDWKCNCHLLVLNVCSRWKVMFIWDDMGMGEDWVLHLPPKFNGYPQYPFPTLIFVCRKC
jgi:hypothetical protein